jgi:hypothetical protein
MFCHLVCSLCFFFFFFFFLFCSLLRGVIVIQQCVLFSKWVDLGCLLSYWVAILWNRLVLCIPHVMFLGVEMYSWV